MDAPQSRDEIEPIETAIRREIDDLLRIRWNPRSLVTRPGAFDAFGLPIPPQHEGRWEVVRALPDGSSPCIYQVRFDGDGNEAYRPIGWWLLDFLRTWDRQNRFYLEEMQRMQAEEDSALRAIANDEEEECTEFLSRVAHHFAGNNGRESWPVSGFGTPAQPASSPATDRASSPSLTASPA